MSTEQVQANKAIVLNFFAAQTNSSLDGFKDCAEDISFWIAGEKSSRRSTIAGKWQGLAELGELRRRSELVVDYFETVDIKHVTAEGDRVAVEAECFIATKNGAIYNNAYHFLFILRDGKIREVKEYLDTALVNEVFGLAADA